MDESITVEIRGDVLHGTLHGDWDMSNVHLLDKALEAELVKKPSVLALDLGDVDFMDSTGVRWLLRTELEVTGYGGTVRVVRTSPPVRRLFDVAGLTDHFGLAD